MTNDYQRVMQPLAKHGFLLGMTLSQVKKIDPLNRLIHRAP